MNSFSVTILGSNSATPAPGRFPTSQVVTMNEQLFLIDCGEGTQIQLRKYGIKMGRINHIFISHLHGDHIYGLPGLLSSLALSGKKGELNIYAHSDLPPMMDAIMKYGNDIPDLTVKYHPLNFRKRTLLFKDRRIQIESFPLKHRIPCCGFLFTEIISEKNLKISALQEYNIPLHQRQNIKKGADLFMDDGSVIPNYLLTDVPHPSRKYAFCTDTVCKKEIIPIIDHVDLLYHEATFTHDLALLAGKTFHTTARQAAELARDANVKKLILGHFSSRYKDLSVFLDEARPFFDQSFLANDGDRIEITTPLPE